MKLSYLVYRAVFRLAGLLVMRRPALQGLEHLPDGPCVIVGNHAQMYGPVAAELYLPFDRAIWCSAEMMHVKEVPAYAFQDFWSRKPRHTRWFYRLLSFLIAPIAACTFSNAHCIGVYRDMRVMRTLRESVRRLQEGANIVIFPEHEVPHNRIVYDFQQSFIDLARLYRHQTGQTLSFVPMYVCPALGRVLFGEPIAYDDAAPADAERARVAQALMDAVTELALSLPAHRVVPYPNLPKKAHPMSKETHA